MLVLLFLNQNTRQILKMMVNDNDKIINDKIIVAKTSAIMIITAAETATMMMGTCLLHALSKEMPDGKSRTF
jgi:glycine cleavage system aminomethyltransferase T